MHKAFIISIAFARTDTISLVVREIPYNFIIKLGMYKGDIEIILFRIENNYHCNAKNKCFETLYNVELKYICLTDVCSGDWHLFEGNCYFFGEIKLNWNDEHVYFIYICFHISVCFIIFVNCIIIIWCLLLITLFLLFPYLLHGENILRSGTYAPWNAFRPDCMLGFWTEIISTQTQTPPFIYNVIFPQHENHTH